MAKIKKIIKAETKYIITFTEVELKFLVQLLGNMNKENVNKFVSEKYNPGNTHFSLFDDLDNILEYKRD